MFPGPFKEYMPLMTAAGRLLIADRTEFFLLLTSQTVTGGLTAVERRGGDFLFVFVFLRKRDSTQGDI